MKKNPIGTIIVLVATVVVFLGLCLPFYKVDAFGINMTVSLLYADGVQVIGIIWAVFAVLTLLFALIGKKVPVLIFGILASLGLFLSYALNNSTLDEYESLGAFVEKGTGNTLCLAGAVVILIAAIIYMATTKTKKDAE
ncbi:hypothetical protein SAMN06297422_102134 [Lachnospiraceae bacterium]|nr:hypothetical protein SAMN06297422_102134 [Lachnospiraceae bacterium]